MGHNGRERQLGHVLGRVQKGTEFLMGDDETTYKVVRVLAFPWFWGTWLVGSYTVMRGGGERVLFPDQRATSIRVVRRIFPENVGPLERFHAFLVDKGWH